MYILTFNKTKSKYFNDALAFAKELGAEFDGKTVTIRIPEEKLFIAYSTFRQLFGLIQNWKNTNATFRRKKVHPYQFIFQIHNTGICESNYLVNPSKNCLTNYENKAWSCNKIDVVLYTIVGFGEYKKNGRFWYNYGYFMGSRWMIDKKLLLNKLLDQVHKKGIDICKVYNESNVQFAVNNLPDFIDPDDIYFKVHYVEQYVDGKLLQIPNNIRHISEKVKWSNAKILFIE